MRDHKDRADETDARVSIPLQYLTTVHHAAYIAGLRSAQELAKGLAFEAWGEELHILASELYEAIDAEAAKEGK